MRKAFDLTDMTFGRLKVIEQAARHPRTNGIRWLCRCTCGNIITVLTGALRHGKVRSCWCLRLEGNHTTHRKSYLPEYKIWNAMKERCRYAKGKDAIGHYQRGIRVCEKWERDFSAFYEDLGPRPDASYSIERRDNDGNYTPDNCYWATRRQQALNRRTTVFLSHRGKTMSLSEWAEEAGLKHGTLYARIIGLRWPINRALNTPCR